MGGQWVAELATVGVTHLGTAPPLVVGIGHCVYTVFRVFAVHVVLVNVGDVALAFCWLRGGWSVGAGKGTAGYSPGVLVTVLRYWPSRQREVWWEGGSGGGSGGGKQASDVGMVLVGNAMPGHVT